MIEGPYKNPSPSHRLQFAFFVLGFALLLLALYCHRAPEKPARVLEDLRPEIEALRAADETLRKIAATQSANIETVAKRAERPQVYRYLDPRPVKLRASRFADHGDKWTGSSSACKLPDDYRRVLPTDFVYAHRDWPCHQLAEICYSGKCIRAIKATSGPFGCILEQGAQPFEGGKCEDKGKYIWCVTTKPREDCRYRGSIDIGAAVADSLGLDGLKTVRVRRVERTEHVKR
jgi:hypothetical protein